MGGKGSGRKDIYKDSPHVKQKQFEEDLVGEGTNRKYLLHALKVSKAPKIDVNDPKQVEERIDWYFQLCLEDDMKPTVTGMCNSLGLDRRTARDWYNERTRPRSAHTDIIKKAYTLLETLWEDYMSNGKINPASGIFLGRNHWGYQDQVEVVVQKPDPLGEATDVKQLAEAYMTALPEDISPAYEHEETDIVVHYDDSNGKTG